MSLRTPEFLSPAFFPLNLFYIFGRYLPPYETSSAYRLSCHSDSHSITYMGPDLCIWPYAGGG